MRNLKLHIFYLLLSCVELVHSQSKTDCNTILVCIAAADYATLFSNSFVKDTLFFAKKTPLKQQTTSIQENILWANLPH